MKILYINQYFIPEIEPSASKVFELSKEFVRQGHTVSVITGFPHYPSGRLYPGHTLRLFKKKVSDGIEVFRVFLVLASTGSFVKRAVGHLTFMVSAAIAGLFLRKPDVVICSCPPLEVALAGWLIARLKRAKFIFEIRDLWPDDAIELGVIRSRIVQTLCRWLERFVYQGADMIVPVSEGFVGYLVNHGVERKRLRVIINGTDIDLFHPACKKERGSNGQGFTCLYLGTIGLQNNSSALIKAIQHVENVYSGIRFVFLGDGCEKSKLVRLCETNNIKNVEFLPPVSREAAAKYVEDADICLIHTKKADINKRHIPAKLYDYMAGGCPVVAGIEGQGRKLIEDAEAGICTEPENPFALQGAIVELIKNKNSRERYGKNGRQYAEKHFSRQKIAAEYLAVINEVVNGVRQ